MPVGALVATGVASVGQAALTGAAANKASSAAQSASAQNIANNQAVYGEAQGNLQPYATRGNRAGAGLMGLLGYGDAAGSQRAWDAYRNSTNYNFLFDQGTQAVKTANAPSFNSGATAKALINYGQGMAGNALQGYEGLLSGQASLGAQSAGALGQIGAGIAGANASSRNNAAGAIGGAALTGANAWGNAFSNMAGLFQQGVSQSSFGGGSSGGYTNALGGTSSAYTGTPYSGDVPF